MFSKNFASKIFVASRFRTQAFRTEKLHQKFYLTVGIRVLLVRRRFGQREIYTKVLYRSLANKFKNYRTI